MLRTIVVAALTLSTAPAFADAAPARLSARVAVTDLDLNGEAGRAELDRRLKKAIHTVCPAPRAPDIPSAFTYRRCIDEARRSAEAGRETALARAAITRLEVASNAR